MSKLILENETHGILGACFEVYREKGCGFTEPVYQDCLELELADRSIQFVPQPEVQLAYKGRLIRSSFRPDFICHRQVILEIKAVSSLASGVLVTTQGWTLLNVGSVLPLTLTGLALGWFARSRHKAQNAALEG